MNNLIGQSLGRYHILEQLGEGGMAIVYKAYDTLLEREVAVKIIRKGAFPPDHLGRILKRFEREAMALARLSHPNIMKVLDYGEREGSPYLVMEYVRGGTLKQKMGKPIPWKESIQLLLPVAEALDYAHSQNMIHRDVKPANILLTKRGLPMLTDFGIAKVLDLEETLDLTGTSAAMGTPEYMAPEQATAKFVDHRADIYSLGVVFYEMVAGRKPFIANTPLAVLIKHATESLPRATQFAPNLPDSVEKVLLRALAKQPDNGYQDMKELASVFKGLLDGKVSDEKVDRDAEVRVVREKAENEAAEKARLEVQEQLRRKDAKEKVEREAAEKIAREKIETAKTEKVRLEAEEQARQKPVKEKAEREATEKADRTRLEREAVKKIAREKEELETAKKVAVERIQRDQFRFKRELFLSNLRKQLNLYSLSFRVYIFPALLALIAIAGVFYIRDSSFNNIPTPTQLPESNFTLAPQINQVSTEAFFPSSTPTITPISIITPTPLPMEITDDKGVSLVLVPAGEFTMGSNSAAPIHPVYLDAFYMDKYEVTNALYKKCVSAGECSPPREVNSYTIKNYYPDFSNHPVINVTWDMAKNYCSWRNARLPSEAEWEKAARGTDSRIYPWGNEIDCSYANYYICRGSANVVGSYESGKSPYGIYDLAGNVEEWVQDWYSSTYYNISPTSNPTGPELGDRRVIRGGGYVYSNSDSIRSDERDAFDPTTYYLTIGFRCAITP